MTHKMVVKRATWIQEHVHSINATLLTTLNTHLLNIYMSVPRLSLITYLHFCVSHSLLIT